MERLYAELAETDVAARRLAGRAVTYGDVAETAAGRLRFEPGSLEVAPDATLTLQHVRAEVLARPAWEDGPDAMRVSATLPGGARQDQALADVGGGLLRGFSIEFAALRSSVVDGVRVVTRALVHRVSLVDSPALPDSLIEAQREPPRRRRRMVF